MVFEDLSLFQIMQCHNYLFAHIVRKMCMDLVIKI